MKGLALRVLCHRPLQYAYMAKLIKQRPNVGTAIGRPSFYNSISLRTKMKYSAFAEYPMCFIRCYIPDKDLRRLMR